MINSTKKQSRSITIIPEALYNVPGKLTLYVTKQPGLSSLYKPNNDIIKKYYKSDEWVVQKEIKVDTISLDAAAKKYDFTDASFIKIDTQGSELDILRSGIELLKNSLVGIYLETLFHLFSHRQPLFAEVDEYLRSYDFELYDLDRVMIRRRGGNIEYFSKRQIVWADCLYFKKYDVIYDGSETSLLMLSKLLMISLAFEHYDLAFEISNLEYLKKYWRNKYNINLCSQIAAYVKARTKIRYLKELRNSIKKIVYMKSAIRKKLFYFSHHDRKL